MLNVANDVECGEGCRLGSIGCFIGSLCVLIRIRRWMLLWPRDDISGAGASIGQGCKF